MPSHLPNWTTIGFVGECPLDGEGPAAAALRTSLDRLEVDYRPLVAVSSIGRGADTLYVEEFARRRSPYFLVLPLAGERFRQNFSDESWRSLATLVEGALSVDEVRGADAAREGYLECGVLAVDRSDIVLVVWDGQTVSERGGTADVVNYARAVDRPLILIDATSGDVTIERLDKAPLRDEAGPATLDPGMSPRELVERHYAELDATAEENAPTTRRLVLQVIWLHLIGAAVGFTGAALNLPGMVGKAFTLIKLAALSVALYLSSKQRRAHHKWKGARLAAEICRSFLAIWPLRRREAQFAALIVDDQADLVRNLTTMWYLDRQAERPLEQARDLYVRDRVRDQIEYFERKHKTDGRRAARLKSIAFAATVVALACNGAVLAMSLGDVSGPAYEITKWCSNLFGLIPPAVLTLVLGHDLAHRSQRFGDAAAVLHSAERRLNLALTWPSLWREVAETEGFLLREVMEWYSKSKKEQPESGPAESAVDD